MSKLTKSNKAELDEILDRRSERRPPTPTVHVENTDDGVANVRIGKKSNELEFAQLTEALGIFDPTMLNGFLMQLGNAVSSGKDVDADAYSFAIGFVKSIDPRDELEAMLAAQMVAAHVCALDSSRRFLSATTYEGKGAAERAMNKFSRTFSAQVETLKRHRQKAQQTVRVERVTVNDGGQAIVGSVEAGGSDGKK